MPRHFTYSGYQAELRKYRDDMDAPPPCDACTAAGRDYRAKWNRKSNKCVKHLGWPAGHRRPWK